VATDDDSVHHSAAERLGDWRAAERDATAAKTAASIAALALKTASAAAEAALETEAAAAAALEAAERATAAAERAKSAATQTAEAARLLAAAALGDKAEANHAVEVAADEESAARDRFHDAENEAFLKD
jgi:hypothetical protein